MVVIACYECHVFTGKHPTTVPNIGIGGDFGVSAGSYALISLIDCRSVMQPFVKIGNVSLHTQCTTGYNTYNSSHALLLTMLQEYLWKSKPNTRSAPLTSTV